MRYRPVPVQFRPFRRRCSQFRGLARMSQRKQLQSATGNRRLMQLAILVTVRSEARTGPEVPRKPAQWSIAERDQDFRRGFRHLGRDLIPSPPIDQLLPIGFGPWFSRPNHFRQIQFSHQRNVGAVYCPGLP